MNTGIINASANICYKAIYRYFSCLNVFASKDALVCAQVEDETFCMVREECEAACIDDPGPADSLVHRSVACFSDTMQIFV